VSGLVTVETARSASPALRLAARCAVGAAHLLAKLPPGRLCGAMEVLRRGARPAGHAKALRARDAVVAVSVRCAGPWCLQRSIAVALLCRLGGAWPDWYTGVRTHPFRAHAWVVADGAVVGEPAEFVSLFCPVLIVRAAR
jgi:hypothetical protein